MDDDINEVFDCFERTLDAEVTEINTIDAAIGGVEDIPPRSYDAPRFQQFDQHGTPSLHPIFFVGNHFLF